MLGVKILEGARKAEERRTLIARPAEERPPHMTAPSNSEVKPEPLEDDTDEFLPS